MVPRLLVVLLAAALAAPASLVRIEVLERSAVLAGKSFGKTGAYERVVARAYFAVDAKLAANRIITDVALAPVNPRGEAEFSADVYLLRPRDPKLGNGTLLFEVSNRGGKGMLRMFNLAESSVNPQTAAQFGDGLLLEQGYTLAWVGWQFDVPDQPGLVRLSAPVARENGKPITGLVRSEFAPDERASRFSLGDRTMIPYPVLDPNDPKIRLTVRDRADAARREVPRSRWSFDGRTHVKGDFAPGKIYEIVYTAQDPPVVGLGPAAVRDFVSHLKYEERSVQRAIGFGISQSGRFLRKFLYDGFNADEQGRRVFDGVMSHVAGAGRGSFNHRFAQPSRDAHPHLNTFYPTDIFPFTDDALLARAVKADVVPKIFFTNSSYEYYGRAASLTHTTPDGKRDVAPQQDTRIYLFAGTQHGPAAFPPPPRRGTRELTNPNDFRYTMRALLAAMNAWITEGKEPPPSRYPRIQDDTLVPVAALRFPKGIDRPKRIHTAWDVDYGSEFAARGVVAFEPPKVRGRYTVLVPQVDADGNETSGIRLPDVAVPLAMYTGWNLRDPAIGAAEELYSMAGSFIPFHREKLPAREAYLEKVGACARELAASGYLLERDIPLLLERAGKQWDWVSAAHR